MKGHARGAAGRLLALLPMVAIERADVRRELVEQLELVREDVDLALVAARSLAGGRPARR